MEIAGRNGPRRIGVFGGTFDPPHFGHLAVANAVQNTLALDEIRFVVANQPWQKTGERLISPADVRLAMVKALVRNHRSFIVDDQEILRGGDSYTIDTVEHLNAQSRNNSVESNQEIEIILIVGADAALGLPTWHRAEELRTKVKVAVVTRVESAEAFADETAIIGDWERLKVEMEPVSISSSQVRQQCQKGESWRELVPEPVALIIDEFGLYR